MRKVEFMEDKADLAGKLDVFFEKESIIIHLFGSTSVATLERRNRS